MKRLDEARTMGDIFQIVKRAVRKVLGVGRAGLELVITYLPEELTAIHQIGSNMIIMNRRIIEVLLTNSRNKSEINAYIFSILLREYIRSLGVLDDADVKKLAVKVAEEVLGESHAACRIIHKLFQLQEEDRESMKEVERKLGDDLEYVRDFDIENMYYIT